MARFTKFVLLCLVLGLGVVAPAQESTVTPNRAWYASTDKERKNDDYLMLKPGETRRVKLSAGYLTRLWSTAFDPTKVTLSLSNGSTFEQYLASRPSTPRVLLKDGRSVVGKFFEKAYTLYPMLHTEFGPNILGEGSELVVTNHLKKENKFYYQVTIAKTQMPVGDPLYGKLAGQVRAGLMGQSTVTQPIEPGQSATWAQGKVPASGAVTLDAMRSLKIELDPPNLEAWRSVRLQAFWDGGDKPNVDVPLLALTSQFFASNPVENGLVKFDGKSLLFKEALTFGNDSRLVLANTGKVAVKATISYQTVKALKSVPLRFCAAYGSAQTQKGKPLKLIDIEGRGSLLGLGMAVAPTPDTQRFSFAYLEGNEIITADGKKFEGTGTEDYFDSAWYFPEKPYSHPYAGMTYKGKEPPKISMYRLMIPDAVPFEKSLSFEMGHGSNNSSNDLEYHWVVFWYQQTPLDFKIEDELKGQWGTSKRELPGGNPGGHDDRHLAPATWGGSAVIIGFAVVFMVLVVFAMQRIFRRSPRP